MGPKKPSPVAKAPAKPIGRGGPAPKAAPPSRGGQIGRGGPTARGAVRGGAAAAKKGAQPAQGRKCSCSI